MEPGRTKSLLCVPFLLSLEQTSNVSSRSLISTYNRPDDHEPRPHTITPHLYELNSWPTPSSQSLNPAHLIVIIHPPSPHPQSKPSSEPSEQHVNNVKSPTTGKCSSKAYMTTSSSVSSRLRAKVLPLQGRPSRPRSSRAGSERGARARIEVV